MKILFHLNSLGRGGAERVVSVLSRSFAKKGYDVVVATQWVAKNEYELHENVRRVSVGLTEKDEKRGRIYRAVKRLFSLRDCIKREKPDLVISFCNKANFRSAFSLIGMKTPLLVSVRNDPKTDYAPYKLPTWLMEKKATGCVFQTPDARDFFSEKLKKNSRIIFNPLSDEYLCDMETKQGSARDKEIVTVGRISRQKNQMLLVKAFEKISADFPEYVVKIYGAAEEEPEVYEQLKAYVEEKNLQEKILFMGASNTIRQDIKDAALFVLPSDYEGMPNALIEAMVSGLPCISTDCPCGGSAMLMENEQSGMLVPVGGEAQLSEAIAYMLTHTDEAEAMGQKAKTILEKVHPQKVCDEWEQYITQMLKQ